MGTEASVLAAILGSRRVPRLTGELAETEDELRAIVADEGLEWWRRNAAEAQLAMLRLVEELRAEERP